MKTRNAVLAAAAVLGVGGVVATQSNWNTTPQPEVEYPSFRSGVCNATDGDTVRCGDERIRLVEIDAPELPGHCHAPRVCALGDPVASKASLQEFLQGHRVYVQRFDKDRYGRTVANVIVLQKGIQSASCHQLTTGHAIRELRWENYKITSTQCPT
jgi:micrococcal nuclease